MVSVAPSVLRVCIGELNEAIPKVASGLRLLTMALCALALVPVLARSGGGASKMIDNLAWALTTAFAGIAGAAVLTCVAAFAVAGLNGQDADSRDPRSVVGLVATGFRTSSVLATGLLVAPLLSAEWSPWQALSIGASLGLVLAAAFLQPPVDRAMRSLDGDRPA